MESSAGTLDDQGDFVCYSWEDQEVVHRELTWADVSPDGRHQGCGLKVAIWRPLYEGYDLRQRRELLEVGVKRSYTARSVDDEVVFRIWALGAGYPSVEDYVKELKRKLGLD